MKYIKVGAGVLNQTPLDWLGNQRRIIEVIQAAKAQKISVLCLPELCISGYGCEDMFLAPATWAQSQRTLLELLPHTQDIIVAVGLPLAYQNRVYDVAALLVNGNLAGFVAKRFLAGDGIHYEPRWFQAWQENQQVMVDLPLFQQANKPSSYPLGDIYFNCDGIGIGFEICEEAWVANRPGIKLAQHGIDIILNPSASHFAFDKHLVRERFVLEGSRAFSASYIYTNLLGNEAGRAIYDGDAMCASRGQLLATNRRFSFKEWQLISTFIDIDLTRISQARTVENMADLKKQINVTFQFPPLYPQDENISGYPSRPFQINHASWEYSPHLKEEEFARAVALGLFDYMRKTRSHGFVLSLSGGADSSAIACLIRMMCEWALNDLGVNEFCTKLNYMDLHQLLAVHSKAQTTEDYDAFLKAVMKKLLSCVYQATENSGFVTQQAASTLAEVLSASYYELNIDAQFKGYVNLVSKALGRKLNWESDDIALQNIQARTRSPSVWLMANVKNALLLATSNRSEAAVGYATMDGDTSGGLSPIAGIDKTFLRQWLRWLETQGTVDFAPIAELNLVNQQQPTAELRPATMSQTDEHDLMPYPLLNAIEKAMIRDRQTPLEIFYVIANQFREYSEEQILAWIERFFRLWTRNQWKRERFAPSFHLDDESLDPKTWCRFPILSGSFERELAEMRTIINKR